MRAKTRQVCTYSETRSWRRLETRWRETVAFRCKSICTIARSARKICLGFCHNELGTIDIKARGFFTREVVSPPDRRRKRIKKYRYKCVGDRDRGMWSGEATITCGSSGGPWNSGQVFPCREAQVGISSVDQRYQNNTRGNNTILIFFRALRLNCSDLSVST